jgi:hypothetical protein
MTDTPDTVKLLNLGMSGAGKTGCLVSLVLAGYHLYILDFDNNSKIIRRILTDMGREDLWTSNVHVAPLRDKITLKNGVPKLQAPMTAWKGAGKALEAWNADNFTPRDVIVMDTLTKGSEAAFNEGLALAGRLNQRPQLADYGWMADSVKLFVDMITAADYPCHVIINTHIKYKEGDETLQTEARGLPNAKGQEISNSIAVNFNTIILTRTKGQGPATRRIISTQPQGIVEVKNENPKGVKPEYPIDTGMAQLFKDILGSGPSNTTSPTPAKEEPSPPAPEQTEAPTQAQDA